MSHVFGQDFNVGIYSTPKKKRQLQRNWIPPLHGCIKINIDASKRYNSGSITIVLVGKISEVLLLLRKGTQTDDCLANREVFRVATRRNLHQIIIENDSRLVRTLSMAKSLVHEISLIL